MKKIYNVILSMLGILLILISIAAFFNVFYLSSAYDPYGIFWVCFSAVPIVGIGVLLKKTSILKSQLYILAIPDLIWTVDFISYIANGKSLFGIVDYFFIESLIIPRMVTLHHLIIVPVIFYATLVLDHKKENSWKISIVQLTLIFFLTRIFTSSEVNINCVYDFCGRFSLNIPYIYPILWFSGAFFMVYMTRKIFILIYRKLS